MTNSPDPSPPVSVLHAFGVAAHPVHRVDGGQGTTFRAGGLALKPCGEGEVEATEWLAAVMESVEEDGFRIARPLRATTGKFLFDRWIATRWIEGITAIDGRWPEAISACVPFHRALRHIAWSPELAKLDNPYTRIDAALWSETPAIEPRLGLTGEKLVAILRPVTLASQLIHGDPSEGNMLFAPGLPVGIIDITPYWHPPEYALAVLISDGIALSGAPVALLDAVRQIPQMDQLLARAVLFRLHVGYHFGGEARAARRAALYAPVVEAIERWQNS